MPTEPLPPLRKLSPQRQQFIKEFVAKPDEGPVAAARRAGFAYPSIAGPQLLAVPEIRAMIRLLKEELGDDLDLDFLANTPAAEAMVLRELALIAFANISDFATWDGETIVLKAASELAASQKAAIRQVSETNVGNRRMTRVVLHDKLAALQDLVKHLKLFQGPSPAEAETAGVVQEAKTAVSQKLDELSTRILASGVVQVLHTAEDPPAEGRAAGGHPDAAAAPRDGRGTEEA